MNIFYNASAGTGKTFRITEKYLDLILKENIDPKKILLMSFNKNVGSELKSEVLKKFDQRFSEKNNQTTQNNNIEIFEIENAPIYTIDAYCKVVLKDNAIDAGLSPTFKLIEEDEEDEILKELSHQIIIKLLDKDLRFYELCSQVKFQNSKKTINIPNSAINIIKSAGIMGVDLDKPDVLLNKPKYSVTINIVETLIKNQKKGTPTENKIIENFKKFINNSNTISDLLEIIEKEKFTFRKIKGWRVELARILKQARIELIYQQNYNLLKSFSKYVSDLYLQYEEYKKNHSLVTFNDILKLATKIIEKKIINPDFNFVIIDEAQDISRVQYKFINALWSQDTNLIICGDHKQSIYNWRGADPNMMLSLENEIRFRKGKIKYLQTSYRSKIDIINPINRIFKNVVFSDKSFIPDTHKNNKCYPNYEKEKLNLNHEINFKYLNNNPCIECLLPDEKKEVNLTNKIELEMEVLAKRILLLIDSNNSKWKPLDRYFNGKFEKIDKENYYRFSDIMILMRTSTHLTILQDTLDKYNIPYISDVQGEGLFSTTPARDLCLLISVICDPNDSYAAIGFLRSPWVGMSDDEIAKNTLNLEKDNVLKVNKKIYEKVVSSRKKLSIYLLSEIVRDWISESKYDMIIASYKQGKQELSNLYKLLDWIRKEERNSRVNSATVHRKLKRFINDPPKKNRALLVDPNQNAIQIKTIHTAKGLTKRIICIPEISFEENKRVKEKSFAFLNIDKKLPKLFFKLKTSSKTEIISPEVEKIISQEKISQEKELTNLFYVAMTRARDFIILSGKNNKNCGWLKHIKPFFDSKDIKKYTYNEILEQKFNDGAYQLPYELEKLKKIIMKISEKKISTEFKRIKTTSLSNEDINYTYNKSVSENTINYGSLGHKILEKAAQNNWDICLEQNILYYYKKFNVLYDDALTLINKLNNTLKFMKKETSKADQLMQEFPFLLKKDNQLIDGVIDLILIQKNKVSIYDYKFSNQSNNTLVKKYKNQILTYAEAVKLKFTLIDKIECYLVIISDSDVYLEEIKLQ